jgi:hypothetical protein
MKGKPSHWIIAVIIIFIMLFATGNYFSEQCSSIGSCRNCWKAIPVAIQSELCPANNTCLAAPAAQQHNAVVDTLVCACSIAKENSYADTKLNAAITDAITEFTGMTLSAEQLCESPGTVLVKSRYG